MDLTDEYLDMRIDSHSEKHIIFHCHMRDYRSRDIQEGDGYVTATMLEAMITIVEYMIPQDVIIHINDIIMSSKNYQQYVEAIRKVLHHLQDQPCWLKERNLKCQFFTNHLYILVHILRPE